MSKHRGQGPHKEAADSVKPKAADLLQIPASLATIASIVAALTWTFRILWVVTLVFAVTAAWVQRRQGRPWRSKWMVVTLVCCMIGSAGLAYSFAPQVGTKPQLTSAKNPTVNIRTNNGQVNVGGTVINNNYGPSLGSSDPNPHGPTVPTNSCPISRSPQPDSLHTLAVDFFVRRYADGECWTTSAIIGETPSTVEFEIRYVNTSNAMQKDVAFSVNLAPGLYLVPGTSYLKNSNYPSGIHLETDALVSNGVIIGSYEPGAAGYFAFEVQTPAIDDLKCGPNVLRAVAYVQPKGLDYFYNTADVDLSRTCASSG